MISTTLLNSLLLVAAASISLASPIQQPLPILPRYSVANEHLEVLSMRASADVDPSAVSEVRCIDPNVNIVFHDQNVAELNICDGIAGTITKCGGSPQSTVGRSGTAEFTLRATATDATINISKGRWEGCVRAARAICPTGSMSGTCTGGATLGNVDFTLDSPS